VVIEPLERGFGYTLGNALRRILLSCIPGAAITEVKIDKDFDESVTLILSSDSEGALTAGHIQTVQDVEVVNPDHVIAHLSKGAKFHAELTVRSGRGYQVSEARKSETEDKEIGLMHLEC